MRPERDQCHFPRHRHHRPRPGRQGHHHGDEIGHDGPDDLQIPSRLPHHLLHPDPIRAAADEPLLGVIPLPAEEKNNMDELFDHAVEQAVGAGYLASGDLVVITAGAPSASREPPTCSRCISWATSWYRGVGATPYTACGNLCVAADEEEALAAFRPGDILVIPQTSNRILSLLRDAAGIVTEAPGLNSHAAIVGMTLEKPVLVDAAVPPASSRAAPP